MKEQIQELKESIERILKAPVVLGQNIIITKGEYHTLQVIDKQISLTMDLYPMQFNLKDANMIISSIEDLSNIKAVTYREFYEDKLVKLNRVLELL